MPAFGSRLPNKHAACQKNQKAAPLARNYFLGAGHPSNDFFFSQHLPASLRSLLLAETWQATHGFFSFFVYSGLAYERLTLINRPHNAMAAGNIHLGIFIEQDPFQSEPEAQAAPANSVQHL